MSDTATLDRARSGLYPESIEAEVSPERLRRFFTREDHMYRVAKEIRDVCIFARQNLVADPPFSRVQLISCRNVLIYMSPALQRQVLPIFHYALEAPGFLVLGTAESVGPLTDLFDTVDRDHKIYGKKPGASRSPLQFASKVHSGVDGAAAGAIAPPGREASVSQEADRLLLSRYAPAGVLVNEDFDVLKFRGQTGAYLETPPGEPTTNVLRMAREGLLRPLRDALLEAKLRGEPARRERVRVRGEESSREMDLLVLPIRASDASAGGLLVLFEPSASPGRTPATARRRLFGRLRGQEPAGEAATSRAPEGEPSEIAGLRQELSATKEYLQALIERQDAANEKLRSASEEIQSSNEELQSTNEELETSKEELESTNEELTTVNEQLHSRNLELNLVNNDLVNLQNSSTIPLVLLGSDLRIRRFSESAKRMLNLLPGDIGRPIGDLAVASEIPELETLLVQVIESVRPVEREIRMPDERWYSLRITPYRTLDNRIEGAVLALVEIDDLKRAHVELRQARDYAEAIVDTVRGPLLVLDSELRVQKANRSFYETFAVTPAETETRLLFELGNRQWDIPALRSLLEDVLPQRQAIHDFEVTHSFPQIGVHTMRLNARLLLRYGQPERILLSLDDVSVERSAEASLHAADRRKDEFLAILSHELRNPLGAMSNSLELMKRVEDLPAPIQQARALLERPLRLITRLVGDLLDVSRISENKIELRLQRVPLDGVVEAAVDNTRGQVAERGHALAVELPPEPLWLYADPLRLTQVITNLLSNAARYTPEGGQIRLTGERDSAAQQIVISVRDSGIGVAPDQLERIFEPFYQASASSGGALGGLGVGLALPKNLVELHDGSIEARSAGTGQGSEFLVRLPAADPQLAPGASAPPDREVTPPARRILLVDDNRDQAESMGLLLERLGHEVRLAHDGSSALEAAREYVPEVAVVDIGLPDIDGYEVARRLRQQPELHPLMLIALTGWGREADRLHSAEAGFEYHLVKPVEIEDLQRLLAISRR